MKRRTECNWKMERHSNAEFSYITILIKSTVWKVTICGVFSGPYFPVFGLNTYRVLRSKSRYSVQIKENTDQKKLRIWTLFTQRLKMAQVSNTLKSGVNEKLTNYRLIPLLFFFLFLTKQLNFQKAIWLQDYHSANHAQY